MVDGIMKVYPKEYLVDHKVTYRKGDKSFRNKVLSRVQEGMKEKRDYICSSYITRTNNSIQKDEPQIMKLNSEKRFPDISTAELKDYGKMKERLRIRLMRRKGNGALLEEVPYQIHPMGAKTVYAEFEVKNGGAVMGMHVTHPILEAWGVSEAELFEAALENSQEKEGVLFHPLEEEFDGLMGRERPENETEDQNTFYFLSNQSKRHGASVLLYPGVLESVHKKLGGDYYILPSSVHEVLVISKASDIPPEALKNTVKAVNRKGVCPEDRLGNGIFEYRGETGILKKCHIPEKEMAY